MLKVEVDDKAVIARFVEMAQESLSPNYYEQFVEIYNAMIETRHLPLERL